MTEKKCSKCGAVKGVELFAVRGRSRDGRASACKSCFATHYGYKPAAERRPLLEYAADQKIFERFLSFVDVGGDDDCWPWLGGTTKGYGAFCVTTGIVVPASRFALAADGRDPGDLDGLHSCDNPICCNPAHLRPGTHAENMRDSARAGGHGIQRLTHAQADEIRELVAGGMTKRATARLYGVSPSTIGDIAARRTHNDGAIGETQ